MQQVAAGGFTFRTLPGYTWKGKMVRSICSPLIKVQPQRVMLLLSGGRPAQFATQNVDTVDAIFDQYVNYYAQRDNFRLGARLPITVDGAAGFTVDLTSIDTAKGFAGRIVMVQPHADQVFVMVGVAPAQQWQTSTVDRFEEVLASVKLFALAASAPSAETATFTHTDTFTHTATTSLETTPQPNTSLTPVSTVVTSGAAHGPNCDHGSD